MIPRLLLLATLALAVLVLAQAPPPIPVPSVSAETTERMEFREPPPSCAQAIKELGLDEQPVHCEEPPAPTYDPPHVHGSYRLYPESYVGPLTYEDMPDTAPQGVVSVNIEVISESSLYAEPPWLPQGYALSSLSIHGYDSEHVIAALYEGPADAIGINRVRQFTWPIDIILPAGDSFTIFETPTLQGVPAVLYYPKPGALLGSDLTVLSFVQGDVETTVLGDHLDPGTATRIALFLICGASCVSPAAAGRQAVDGTMSGASPQPAAATQQAGVTAPDSGTSSGGATNPLPTEIPEQFPTEHRVIVGLGVASAEVVQWWHGFDYPPGAEEAALDLGHPDGPQYTGGLNVYVITWPWSGSGGHVVHNTTIPARSVLL